MHPLCACFYTNKSRQWCMLLLLLLFSDVYMLCSYGTFATGGCDGIVNVWDGNNKKRLYQVNMMILYC